MNLRIVPQTSHGHVLANLFLLASDWFFLLWFKHELLNHPALFYLLYFLLLLTGGGLGTYAHRWLRETLPQLNDEVLLIVSGVAFSLAVTILELSLLGYPGAGFTILLGWGARLLLERPHEPTTR